jgi:hypothetical protein
MQPKKNPNRHSISRNRSSRSGSTQRKVQSAAIPKSTILLNRLIHEAPPSFTSWHISEPKLVFANKKTCEDPKTGIALYGPAALDRGPRRSLRLGIIGSGDTIQLLRNFLERAKGPIHAGLNARGKPYDSVLSPKFPGFTGESPFECDVEVTDSLTETLTEKELEAATVSQNYQERVKAVVQLVCRRLAVMADKDPAPDVVVCAMPTIVEEKCGVKGRKGRSRRPKLSRAQKVQEKLEKVAAATGQILLPFEADKIGEDVPVELNQYWDFHNALKAAAMETKLSTQLVWESTLSGEGRNQDPATTAWNFFTALYYKAGNVPWELDFSTTGTCFVGVTFYRESPDPNSAMRTSLAQVFTETGEGFVLKGGEVKWDKDRDKKPHLSKESAKDLLKRALDLYREHYKDRPPTRVVVYKTSRYWPEELEGFKEALTDIHSYDFLALERRGIRFLRLGHEPPIRGTVIQLAKRNYLVYTQGYIPFLHAFPGMRVPNPLEVVEHWGDSSAEKVCSEILALTKLNWNTCSYGSGDPISIAFSKQVGRILTEVGNGPVLSKYRYFM